MGVIVRKDSVKRREDILYLFILISITGKAKVMEMIGLWGRRAVFIGMVVVNIVEV